MNAEKKRGYQEALSQIETLRNKWPRAFPAKSHEIRPLAVGTTQAISDAMGWDRSYTRAVLQTWKAQRAYCTAVLVYPDRIGLDGEASGPPVDDKARAQAKEDLARMAQRAERRKAEKLDREAARQSAV